MTRNQSLDQKIARLIGYLGSLEGPKGRAKLAELRRSATDPLNDYRSIWVLDDKLPDGKGWQFDAFRIVASFYALHKQKFSESPLPAFKKGTYRKSFGASLRMLRDRLTVGEESMDQRFAALLDTPKEDLVTPLRNFIQRIANSDKRIEVDYNQLLRDLIYWDAHDSILDPKAEPVQRKWARHYWQPNLQIDTENVDSNSDNEPKSTDHENN